MSDPLASATPGRASPFVNKASTINTALHLLRKARQTAHGRFGGGPPANDPFVAQTLVKYENTTGGTIPAWSVLTPTGPLVVPADHPFEARRKPAFTVSAPVTATDAVFITTEPAAAGAIGTAASAGVTVAMVDLVDVTHAFARPIPGSIFQLQSAESGPVRILALSSTGSASTGSQLCYVLLGSEQPGGFLAVVMSSASGGTYTVRRLTTGRVWTSPTRDYSDCESTVSVATPLDVDTVVWAEPKTDDVGYWITPVPEVQMSIDRDQFGLMLLNDEDSPGENMVYGTDVNGIKGWQPAGGSTPDVSGYAELTSQYVVSAEDTWEDVGCEITLPEPGVYLISWWFQARVTAVESFTQGSSRLIDDADAVLRGTSNRFGSTDQQELVDGGSIDFCPGFTTRYDFDGGSGGSSGTKTIRLQGYRENGTAGADTDFDVTFNYVNLEYVKLR